MLSKTGIHGPRGGGAILNGVFENIQDIALPNFKKKPYKVHAVAVFSAFWLESRKHGPASPAVLRAGIWPGTW